MKNEIVGLVKKCGTSVLDWSLRFRCFQDYVDSHYNSDAIIEVPGGGRYFVYDGLKYCTGYNLLTIRQVKDEYQFADIAPDDVILDIGGYIGAFSLYASKMAKYVFAVEPLYANELRWNIALNNINNISVLECGLGVDNQKYIEYDQKKGKIDLLCLSEILSKVGKCDFLKIDCEGCEWGIEPSELKGFRRIEGELHNFDGKHDFKLFEKKLIKAGFTYTMDKKSNELCLIHAKAR